MSKRGITTLFALLLLTFSFNIVSAQTPFVAVYFDQFLQQETAMCPLAPPNTVLQKLYVAALNFNTQITGIEFKVNYPPELQYIGEIYPSPLAGIAVGDTQVGLQLGFSPPANGNFGIMVAEVTIRWTCSSCSSTADVPLTVVGHPSSGLVQAIDVFTGLPVVGVGLTAIICPLIIPVEETTWGGIKALYN